MAATVVDSLIVQLQLSDAEYKKAVNDAVKGTKDFKEATRRDSSDIEHYNRSMRDGFRSVRTEILGLFAVAAGAHTLKGFIADTINTQANLGFMSQNLNTSARDLDAWGKMAKTVGGDANSLTRSFQNISTGLQNFSMGEASSVVDAFRYIGVQLTERVNGRDQTRSFLDIMTEASSKIQSLTPQQQLAFAERGGFDAAGLKLLRMGPEAIQKMYREMQANSGVTDESVRKAQEAQKAWGEFLGEMRGVGQTVFEAASPAIVQLTQDLRDFGDWLNDHKDDVSGFFQDGVHLLEAITQWAKEGDNTGTKLMAIAAGLVAIRSGLLGLAVAKGGASVLTRLLGIGGAAAGAGMAVGAAAALYSSSLNSGEDAELLKNKVNLGYASAADREKFAVQYLQKKGGFTQEEAFAIVGNLKQETTGYDPKAVGDGGHAYGLAQWHEDRQANFRKQFGIDIKDSRFSDQLDFIAWELRGTHSRAYRKMQEASDVAGKAAAFSQYYEAPRDVEVEKARRAKLATQVMQNNLYPAGYNPSDIPVASTTTHQSEVNIQNLTVQTQATDAAGIARDLPAAMRENALINGLSSGMQD